MATSRLIRLQSFSSKIYEGISVIPPLLEDEKIYKKKKIIEIIMTKLVEWLSALAVLATIWISLLTNKVENSFAKEHPKLLLYTPLISLASFGLYAAVAVLYQTLNFNNCEDAAEELLKDINEAKTSLAFKGYKFPERS